MKQLKTVILIFTLLLQSCYTYKSIDIKSNELEAGKMYRMMVNEKEFTARIVAIKSDNIQITTKKNRATIPLNEVHSIKKKKQQTLLTMGIIAVATAVLVYLVKDNNQENLLPHERTGS